VKRFALPALALAGSLLVAGCGAGSPPPASHAGGDPPGASSAPASGPALRVTEADNGRTLTLQVGQTFLLALGDLLWTVHVADPTVLARVPNVLVVRGAQGLYRALRPGETTIHATGRPNCPSGQPCPMFVAAFDLTVRVTG
jgi:hypothetical protein